jgi:hypothetical protein
MNAHSLQRALRICGKSLDCFNNFDGSYAQFLKIALCIKGPGVSPGDQTLKSLYQY